MKAVRTAAVGLVLGAALLVPAGAATAAANPSGTGKPSQSCQDIEANGGTTPGHDLVGRRIMQRLPSRHPASAVPRQAE